MKFVTWPNWNRNISRRLHFQTMVLMWFWISITLAFQRYITWPYLEKKIIFVHINITSRDHVTSQENCPIEYFENSGNRKPLGHRQWISNNLSWVFSLNLKHGSAYPCNVYITVYKLYICLKLQDLLCFLGNQRCFIFEMNTCNCILLMI